MARRREFADVYLLPFEMAIRDGGARSVMHSYASVDGVPPAADHALLTGILRDELGFEGVVVSDYYGISFLQSLHGVAGSPAEAAALALRAGVDVELPSVHCYGGPLADAAAAGQVPEHLIGAHVGNGLGPNLLLAERSEDLGYVFALDLGDGILIHGTDDSSSIGHRASHGCIRLPDEMMQTLWRDVPVGTDVYIFESQPVQTASKDRHSDLDF